MKLTRDFGVTLVCPSCRVEVVGVNDAYICCSGECRRSYPVVDGIPKFLVDDARVLAPEEWRALVPHDSNRAPGN